jgi:rubrerythrin
MEESVEKAIDDLNDDQLEDALFTFIAEHQLTGEFLVWLKKWKAIHKIVSQEEQYVCPKCHFSINGEDHPNKHHLLCPIANLAKKDKDGNFVKEVR